MSEKELGLLNGKGRNNVEENDGVTKGKLISLGCLSVCVSRKVRIQGATLGPFPVCVFTGYRGLRIEDKIR